MIPARECAPIKVPAFQPRRAAALSFRYRFDIAETRADKAPRSARHVYVPPAISSPFSLAALAIVPLPIISAPYEYLPWRKKSRKRRRSTPLGVARRDKSSPAFAREKGRALSGIARTCRRPSMRRGLKKAADDNSPSRRYEDITRGDRAEYLEA